MKKKMIAVIMDIIFLVAIVLAVYLLIVNNAYNINQNILYIVIILLIPAGFFVTYTSFAKEIDWDRFNEEENEMQDEIQDEMQDDMKDNMNIEESSKTDNN